MFRRFMIFVLLIFLLLVAFRFRDDASVFLLLCSFTLVPLYHFIFRRERVALVFSAALVGLAFLIQALISFSWPWIGFAVSYVLFLGIAFYFRRLWNKEREDVDERKASSDHSVERLRALVEKERGRCCDLEMQLSEIIGLYELAKDLNLCMNFEEVIRVLNSRILDDMAFSYMRLILKDADRASCAYEIEGVHDSRFRVLTKELEWEEKVVQKLNSMPSILRFGESTGDTEVEVLGKKLVAPVWIFPLVVEGKLIAALVIEGGRLRDFHKFEIISAQLALQVKKVNLYSTVKEFSIMDGLTHVFVRRHFLERFEEELKRSIRHEFNLICLMVDIDHFKTYNDNFGHLVGDVTLRAVAEIIHANVRQVDIVCRYGGEEFAIVLPETTKEEGIEVAERIRSRIAKKHFRFYDEETKVTVSIGTSAFPNNLDYNPGVFDRDLMLELLKRADQALYTAKDEGRNRVVLYS